MSDKPEMTPPAARAAPRTSFSALLVVSALLAFGCGDAGDGGTGDRSAVAQTETTTTTTETETTTEGTAGGVPVGVGQDESDANVPFTLNFDQPIPPDFRAAYQRKTLISVHFYGQSSDPFYPQGLTPDESVNASMEELRGEYPTVEFFSYDIGQPGDVSEGSTLEPGQYGTLAAQLNVGYTPFVVTLAPSGDGYVILNRLQGYTPQTVLSQALFDLSSIEVADNSSDLDVTVDEVRLTDTGGGIEYFTVSNRSGETVDLQGFSLRRMDPDTGEVTTDSPGVSIDDTLELSADDTLSVGRVPDIEGGEGDPVEGTFTGGQELDLSPGDQVALLDSGGAVTATFSIGQ